jgi:hypothetical protein
VVQETGTKTTTFELPRFLLVVLVSTVCSQSALPAAAGDATAASGLLIYSEQRAPCTNRNPWRNAYFGDLHVHTGLSLDAYQQNVRTRPDDAYAFARGREIQFHATTARIDRPLDFAAVTEHAEFLGELGRCADPKDPMHGSGRCEFWRTGSAASDEFLREAFESLESGSPEQRVREALRQLFHSEEPKRDMELCGADGTACAAAAASAWGIVQAAAETAYDRSSECSFSTFVGYEYTGTNSGSNNHRNVIFRNARVPVTPVSAIDAPRAELLWQQLDRDCMQSIEDCEYLAIPHNSNLSNGKLLAPDYAGVTQAFEQRASALQRQRAEPLMEIFQHKGQSECINGISGIVAAPDPLCDIEQVRAVGGITTILGIDLVTTDCGDGFGDGGMIDTGCVSRNDYLRGALLTGLAEEQRLGVNPLRLGVVASTDTHEATPGAVDEQTWRGHVGREAELEERLQQKPGLPYRLEGNPGGLAGVWAVENSRDAIFDALQRREVFGTSGPRIRPRFFGGWSFQADFCAQANLHEKGYASGVPMGSNLPASPSEAAKPRFVAYALRDPEGQPLERLQIVKGWIDEDGRAHVSVTDIAGDTEGRGSSALCNIYTDETFQTEQPSYYYLRVVEVPSARWSRAQCVSLPDDTRPAACMNDAPRWTSEMAWSSPIWYQPAAVPIRE